MSTQTAFIGSWLVSEYIYNSNGSFAGINHQRRMLETLSNGNIRVTQICDPSPELDNHPLGRFRGKWVFDLSTDGRARRYHGPDVIGTGLSWGAGVITGRGFWTRLGFNFTSYGMLATPDRQLTGGKFFTASEMKANIVGLAVNEEQSNGQYPAFDERQYPEQVSAKWSGSICRLKADGSLEVEENFSKQCTGNGWEESGSYPVWDFGPTPDQNTQRLTCDSITGLSKRVGAMLEAELVAGPGAVLELTEILDPADGNLLGLRKWFVDHALTHVEFYRLKPEE